MPLITIEAAGPIPPEQKEELIRTIPAQTAKIMNVPIEEFRLFIREYDPSNIGIGDVPLRKVFEERKQ